MGMNEKVGHVYVMINPSMEGLVKIGRTSRTATMRAKDLQTTGVPKSFIVLWSEFVQDSDEVEETLHTMFADSRVNPRREFFKVEPRDAISALMEVALPHRFRLDEKSARLSIFTRLQEKFASLLRDDLSDVKIAQNEDGVYLETLRRPYQDKSREVVEYIDLDVVGNLCSTRATVSYNADRFMTLGEFDLVNVTDLIEESAAKTIWDEHPNLVLTSNEVEKHLK